MNNEALFLFLILLLGLILCSFLGGNCGTIEGLTSGEFTGENKSNYNLSYTRQSNDQTQSQASMTNYDNYNHFDGSSMPSTFYASDGSTIKLSSGDLIETDKNGSSITYKISNDTSGNRQTIMETNRTTEGFTPYTGDILVRKYIASNGAYATIINTDKGVAVKIHYADGNEKIFYATRHYTYNPDYINVGANIPYNPPGYNPPGSVGAYNPPGYNPPGATQPVYNPPGYNPPGSVGAYNPPGYNPPGTNVYSSSLPPGIPRSQIPSGDEDLYILKSEVVPPVCPACPTVCPKQEKKCQPCPPCARCPEPSFECKKVPNYNAANNEYLPVPVVNDFSTFGM